MQDQKKKKKQNSDYLNFKNYQDQFINTTPAIWDVSTWSQHRMLQDKAKTRVTPALAKTLQ